MVPKSLVRLCFSGGYDPCPVVSHRVGDDQESAIDHANEDQAQLTVILAIVHEIDRKWVVDRVARLLEAHAVLGEIGSSLRVIPLEFVRIHDTTVYP